MTTDTPILPAHIEDTVQAIAKLHAEHYQQSTRLQRVVDCTTALVGRPGFVGLLMLVMLVWTLVNLNRVHFGTVGFLSWLGILLFPYDDIHRKRLFQISVTS
jgi:uncharacterized membrane protein